MTEGNALLRHCPVCNSQRPGKLCWKCETLTDVAPPAWVYPKLPDIRHIRSLAREVGYAIGVHGSQERDLDVIAAPWTDSAVTPADLLKHLASGLGAKIAATEPKPLGRIAATLQIDGYYRPLDISVMPCSTELGPGIHN